MPLSHGEYRAVIAGHLFVDGLSVFLVSASADVEHECSVAPFVDEDSGVLEVNADVEDG